MKSKLLLLFFTLLMVFFTLTTYAANEQVTATLSKKISIIYNNEMKEFSDVNGKKVYPILYQGTTYLPVRAISALFGISVKWDGENNKIYLSNGETDSSTCKTITTFISDENESVSPYLNQTISIEYKENIQTFKDVNGNVVYPLSYQGTTYLPVRAISNMYGASILWNGETNTITLERKNEIAEITNVTIKVIQGTVCAVITTNSPLYDYKYYSLAEPNRLIIDLQNSKFNMKKDAQSIKYDVLQSIRFGDQGNNVSRVVLDVDEIDKYKVVQSEDRLITYFALSENFEIPSDTQNKDYTLIASIGNTIYIPDIENNNDNENSGDDNQSGSNDNEKPTTKLAKVTAVTFSPSSEITKIMIDGNCEFVTSTLANPERFIVDIKGAVLETDGPTEITPKNKNITKIRFAQNTEEIVRVVFELAEKAIGNVAEKSDYFQVSFEDVKVENIKYETFKDYATLTLRDVKKSIFSTNESSRYNRYTLTYSSTKFKTESDTLEPDDDFVSSIEIKSSKIIINGAEDVLYSIKQVGTDTVVTISKDTKSNTSDKFVVLLDAGHGGKDPGACYGNTEAEKYLPENQEKTYTLAVMLKVKKLLEQEDDIEVRTSRTTDVFIDRQGRIDYVLDNEDANMLVSVHINSAATKAYSGTMVLFYNKPDEEKDYGITSKDIATIVKNNIVKDTGLIDKGTVSRKDIWILEQNSAGQISMNAGEERPVTNLPAILCELCFISNDDDHAKLMDEDFQDSIANAIYEGILQSKAQAGK